MAFADRRCKTASPNPSTTTTTPGLSRQDSREGRQDNDDTSTWDYMAQTSAFHGVGKIRSAPNRCLKVLWLLCLLGMTSAMVYQLIKLTTTFFAFPVKTSVNLAFSPLLLPAITVCNSNPLRLTKVRTLNCPLQSFLRVEDQYKSPECVNETTSLRNDPVVLCERFNLFCSANDTEDVNMFALRKKRTQLEIVKENRTLIKAAGHQIEDLIIDCNFAGINCFARSFSREWTMEYGNCFTMNTTLMQAFDSGPPSGLDIIFNLQTEEMLPSYKTGFGLRVVVHEQNTRPFPSSEGVTLSPGFETHFGLRLEEVTRLGGHYGNCRDDDSGLFDEIQFKYSTKTCRTLCLEQQELRRCGCTDAIARVATPTENVTICNTTRDFNCTWKVTQEYLDTVTSGFSFCPCGNPCQELVYRVRTSARKWPISSFIPVLEEDVCRLDNLTEEQVTRCKAEKAKQSMEQRMGSYVRLRVYFETLNYERITQEPFYDAERFLSDIGGTLGLWIGASLLGLGEALELLFYSLIHFYRYLRGRSFFLSNPSPTAHNSTNNNDSNGHTGRRIAMVYTNDRQDSRCDLVDVNTA